MRMWMIDPDLMCNKHLLGEHGEIHKHCHNFVKKHSVRKRLELRQIFPSLMKKRHDELAQEMIRRGMKHNSPYEMPDISYLGEEGLIVPTEQDIQNNLIDLAGRCEECRDLINSTHKRYFVI